MSGAKSNWGDIVRASIILMLLALVGGWRTAAAYPPPPIEPETNAPRPPVATPAAPAAQEPGIYGLQASLRFDDLQMVVFDRSANSLTLIGQRRSPERLISIRYLDHLAAALEAHHPTFSLPWSEEATRQADVLIRQSQGAKPLLWERIVSNARRQLFNPQDRLTREGLRILATLNFPADDYEPFMTNKFDVMARAFEICGGEQQATIVGSYARSLRDPDELNAAIEELAMARALSASTTGPDSAELWETFLRRYAGVFDLDPSRSVGVFRLAQKDGLHLVQARNLAVENILRNIDPLWAKTFASSLELSAARNPHIHLPPDLVRSLAEITIHVKPTWTGIDPTSRLAEVMFDADLLLKWIVADPSLIEGDRVWRLTEYEWSQRQRRTGPKAQADNVRFWISPDVVEISESADGAALEIRKLTMRVNTSDPASQPYADYLTSMYDQLADEIPTLQELREGAKLVVVAQWLKKRYPDFTLPQAGRSRWDPPEWAFGFISLNSQVDVRRTDAHDETRITGKWTCQATLEGGVSLALGPGVAPDGNVLFDGARGPRYTLGNIRIVSPGPPDAVRIDDIRRTIVPQIYDNQALMTVLRQKTIPPPPTAPGATGVARLGTRKLEYIQVLQHQLREQADAEAIQRDLQQALVLARKLQFNDRMLNELRARQISSIEAFDQWERWAREEREQFLVDLIDIGSGGLSTWLGAQKYMHYKSKIGESVYAPYRMPREWLLLSSEYLPKIKTTLSDVNTARQAAAKGEYFEWSLATTTRSIELLAELNEALAAVSETLAERTPFYASLTADAMKGFAKIEELKANLQQVEIRAEQVGQEAQYSQRLQDRQEAYLQQLDAILKRLERARRQ